MSLLSHPADNWLDILFLQIGTWDISFTFKNVHVAWKFFLDWSRKYPGLVVLIVDHSFLVIRNFFILDHQIQPFHFILKLFLCHLQPFYLLILHICILLLYQLIVHQRGILFIKEETNVFN